jgi:hypothetical protein
MPRWAWGALALGLLVNLLPLLVSRYLPFADIYGIQGLVAVLANHDPAARHAEYYSIDVRLLPTVLYQAVLWQLQRILPLPVASHLFVALFWILALPAALLTALRLLSRDLRLVLLCLPLLYLHATFLGLMNFVAAVPPVLVGVALLSRALDPDGPERLSWRTVGLLALLTLLIAFTHAFVLQYFMGLVVILLVLGQVARWRPRVIVQVGLAIAPTALFVGRWTRGTLGTSTLDILIDQTWNGTHSLRHSAGLLYRWTVDNFRGHAGDLVLIGLSASVLGALVWAVTTRRRLQGTWWSTAEPRDLRARLWELRFVVLLAATAVLFYLLPFVVVRPFYWWGVSIRMVPFLWLLGILCIPKAPRPVPALVLAPAVLAGVLAGAVLTHNLITWYTPVETAGLEQAVDDIPPGQRVLTLYGDLGADPRYMHPTLFYAGAVYVARRGGLALPMIMGSGRDNLWAKPKVSPPHPPGGLARLFRWAEHGAGWDYFLVKDSPPGMAPRAPLFADAPAGAVEKVSQHGLWGVYRRTQGAR